MSSEINDRIWKFLKEVKSENRSKWPKKVSKKGETDVLIELVRRMENIIEKEKSQNNFLTDLLKVCKDELSIRKLDTRNTKLKQLGI